MNAPYKLEPGEAPPNGVAQGNKDTASTWDLVWRIGHSAGYAKRDLEAISEAARLRSRIQRWRDAAFVAGAVALAAIIVLVNGIIK